MQQNQKIALFQVRNFGEKFLATFDFLSQNRNTFLRYLLCIFLPISLFQALGLTIMLPGDLAAEQGNYPASGEDIIHLFLSEGLTFVCSFVGSIMIVVLMATLIRTYSEREQGLDGITWAQVQPLMKKMGVRTFLLAFTMVMFAMIVAVVMVLLVFITGGGAFAGILVLIGMVVAFLCVPLVLVTPVYLYEDDTPVLDAYVRAFKIGWHTYWSMLGFLLVVGLVCFVLNMLVMIPWYVMFFIKALSLGSTAVGVISNDILYNVGLYLMGVLMCVGSYAVSMVSLTAYFFQYGTSRERLEGTSATQDVNQTDHMDADDDNKQTDDRISFD